jgi:hypothetical protein
MKRAILAGFLGLLTWILVVSIIDRILRLVITGYTDAEHTLQFTLAMKFARLLMAAATSIVAGAVVRWIAPLNSWVAPTVGAIVFALFLPMHIAIWSKFPVWYHLTFLLSIIPLVMLGSKLALSSPAQLNPSVPQRS